MKVAIIGSAGIPAKYGGFETLTEYLTKYLGDKFDITVYCSSKNTQKKIPSHNKSKLFYIPLNANGIQSIPYDIISIFHALLFSDTLLILGVSGCITIPFFKLFTKKRFLVNIDGLEWKRAKWNKYAKWFLKYSEKIACLHADEIIADNKVIQQYVKEEYGKDAHLITYGADHSFPEKLNQETIEQYSFLKENYAFKVCRIEPENNIHLILEAFKDQKNIPLVIIGNWNNSAYGVKLLEKYRNINNIHLIQPIYDQKILNQIRSNCYIYIHGHSAGGTNPSLVEAMYLSLPILAFGVNYNKETTFLQAKYFDTQEELVQLLNSIESSDLEKMAQINSHYSKKYYTWNKISNDYASLF
ncbi:DUF1972 domain-containing protein [Flammeovirga sp. EKP202]|uniref:DUF1972 domain-containing protein n=1 Tax=Flammeovirga sp. EKP202 TaxID=2770592 RepID=UPI00165F9428|nr:DUF1972 domain-containing protein [Flammeovirga sp. EKP202]MBD0404489.1 DUF1972 domain-containing protein [Flammeovirga sp. EKP202]